MNKLSEIFDEPDKYVNMMYFILVATFAIVVIVWGTCKSIVMVLDAAYGNNTPNIKAVEVNDTRQYKFIDKENNAEYVITDKPDGVTTSRKNIE